MQNSQTLNIVADEEIPLVRTLFGQFTQIKLKPGDEIQREDLINADILLVRSITRVDEALLHNTPVKFVGIAAAGIDHVDGNWLDKNKIIWHNAKGSNAHAVAEYVLCCIAALQQKKLLHDAPLRVGLIGIGNIGKAVKHYFDQLGYEVLCHDPPKAAKEKNFVSTPLSHLIDCNLISIHASLEKKGEHPSFHLIDEKFLASLKEGTILINTARGAVVDSQALLNHRSIIACLDVWENEPWIDLALLDHATIATCHIAGYSKNAKINATFMLYEQMQNYFNLPSLTEKNELLNNNIKKIKLDKNKDWQSMLLNHYNPFDDTKEMKTKLLNDPKNIGENFYWLRKNYRWREEFIDLCHPAA